MKTASAQFGMLLACALASAGCQELGRGTSGGTVESGIGREEGSTPYAVDRTSPYQRAGMSDANIAAGRAEAAMDVSGPGTSELSRRSAAATVVGTGRDPLELRSRDLEVVAPDRTADEMLLDRIRQALGSPNDKNTESLRPLSIQSLNNLRLDVSGGTVTLSGRVADDREREEIQSVVSRVEGVRDVVNQLEVQP